MSESASEGAEKGATAQRTTSGSAHHGDIDWERAERSAEFQELIARKRKFVLPAVVFFLAWYTIFILLAGYAEGFMGTRITGGLTVGYLLALTQFVMVWGLAFAYVRKADREFEPLEQKAAQRAVEAIREQVGDKGLDDAGVPRGAVSGS